MSHPAQREFIQIAKSLFPEMFTGKRVLEVGSLDINGSVRAYFSDCEYIGLDIASGRGVDVVCQGQDYAAPSESFDVVISCEVMEHNPYWVATLTNMIRVLKPGGLLVMSCATIGRAEHGTARSQPISSPFTIEQGWNYYKNLTKWHLYWNVDLSPVNSRRFASNWETWDLYLLGVKHDDAGLAVQRLTDFAAFYKSRCVSVWRSRAGRVIREPARFLKIFSRPGWW